MAKPPSEGASGIGYSCRACGIPYYTVSSRLSRGDSILEKQDQSSACDLRVERHGLGQVSAK